MIRFMCPTCQTVMKAPDQGSGRKASCPKCGQRLLIPPPAQVNPKNKTVLGEPLPDSTSPTIEQPDTQKNEQLPRPGASMQYSGLGIASFIIALVVGGMEFILGLLMVANISHSDSHDVLENRVVAGGMSLFCYNLVSVPACLVGVGLAVVGLVAHRGRNHLFTNIGLVGNGAVIVLVLLFVFLSYATSPEYKVTLSENWPLIVACLVAAIVIIFLIPLPKRRP